MDEQFGLAGPTRLIGKSQFSQATQLRQISGILPGLRPRVPRVYWGIAQVLTTDQLRKCRNVQAILSCALDRSMEVSKSHFGNVQLMNWKSGFLELNEQRGFQTEFLNFFSRVKLQDGTACARALHSRDAIIVEDVMVDPHFARCRDIIERAGIRAVQSTPLIFSSGALVGILSTHFAAPSRPTDQQMLAMRNASQLVANAIIHIRMRAATDYIESSMRLMDESQQVLATAEKILSRTYQLGSRQ